MRKRHLTIPLLALTLMTACTDGTGIEPDDLAGIWTANSMVFTSVADTSVSMDMITEGATLSVTLGEDAGYVLVLTFPEEEDENELGTYVVDATTITFTPTGEGEVTVFGIARDGDILVLSDDDEMFEFDEQEEPATMEIVMSR